MTYKLRPYQEEAVKASVEFLQTKSIANGLVICPTGSGKSVIIAEIAFRMNQNVLVLCPSKEITEQNYSKMKTYTDECSMYSASVGVKEISKVTFATIGSIRTKPEEFKAFRIIIVDEAHTVNAKGGMYKDFFLKIGARILGLTATPYRLVSSRFYTMLKFITRTRPVVFNQVIYCIQITDLVNQGFLARLRYFYLPCRDWDAGNLEKNSNGSEYTDESIKNEYARVDFHHHMWSVVERLKKPKDGTKRKGILVFTQFVEDAERAVLCVPHSDIVTGKTPKKEREQKIADFRSGKIEVLFNVNCLSVGFDYPELDTIVLARPTMSLALYYQQVGRALRPSPGKDGWIVDLVGNTQTFGKVEELVVTDRTKDGKWIVKNSRRQLTNVLL